MLLFSSTTAFRGDSSRQLLWSDLFMANIPLPAVGLDAKIMVSSIAFSR